MHAKSNSATTSNRSEKLKPLRVRSRSFNSKKFQHTKSNLIKHKSEESIDRLDDVETNDEESVLETYSKLANKKKEIQTEKRDSINSIESNTSSTTVTSKFDNSNAILGVLVKPEKFLCSSSYVDLCLLIFRYKDVCQHLIDMVIPLGSVKKNQKFFQAKFNCLNNMFQVNFVFKIRLFYINPLIRT